MRLKGLAESSAEVRDGETLAEGADAGREVLMRTLMLGKILLGEIMLGRTTLGRLRKRLGSD